MTKGFCAMAAGVVLGLSARGAQAADPSRLELTMTPHATGGADSYVAVRMTLQAPNLPSGGPLAHLPLTLVGIPTVRLDGDALTARDDKGSIALTQSEEPPTPQGVYRRWSVTRATVGDVVISYRAAPRKVTAATNNGPLFDLREERGGFAGAGVGFVATPVAPGPYRVRLHWDLTQAPAGTIGVWSFGEGDVERVLGADELAFSYYDVGPLKTYPAAGRAQFGLYWLSDPPFDAAALGDRVQKIYGLLADFFGARDASYRVFVRQNPYRGFGGSALAHSFMFGYNPADHPTVESLQGSLSHEITHNWPAMQGEHGDTAWYSEGTAEYYSILLGYRGGLLTTDAYLKAINAKADGYYTNPYRELSNPDAAKIFWSDAIAQTVPYGRGFMYLARTDAAIRAASGGRRSLDDVVKQMRIRQVKRQSYGIAEWLELVGREIGAAAAKRDYDAMAAGALLAAPADRFSPCFTAQQTQVQPFQLGFARASLNDERVIHGLQPGSAAARAGLRDGDVIVSLNDLEKVREDEALSLSMTVRRGGVEIPITYKPRGAPETAWRWVRNANVADAACRF